MLLLKAQAELLHKKVLLNWGENIKKFTLDHRSLVYQTVHIGVLHIIHLLSFFVRLFDFFFAFSITFAAFLSINRRPCWIFERNKNTMCPQGCADWGTVTEKWRWQHQAPVLLCKGVPPETWAAGVAAPLISQPLDSTKVVFTPTAQLLCSDTAGKSRYEFAHFVWVVSCSHGSIVKQAKVHKKPKLALCHCAATCVALAQFTVPKEKHRNEALLYLYLKTSQSKTNEAITSDSHCKAAWMHTLLSPAESLRLPLSTLRLCFYLWWPSKEGRTCTPFLSPGL